MGNNLNKKHFIKELESKYDGWEVYVNASEITFINNTWFSEKELSLNQIANFMDYCRVSNFDKVLVRTNARYFREEREVVATISIIIKHDLKFED